MEVSGTLLNSGFTSFTGFFAKIEVSGTLFCIWCWKCEVWPEMKVKVSEIPKKFQSNSKYIWNFIENTHIPRKFQWKSIGIWEIQNNSTFPFSTWKSFVL